MSTEPEARPGFASVLAAYRGNRQPRRNRRIFQTPTGFVEIVFFSHRRAWVTIYNHEGWPSRRLRRWATRDHPSLARALQRGGFSAGDADRLSERISEEWGEPIGDVADVVIPTATTMVLTAVGAVVVGRWLLGRVTAV